MLKHTGLNPAFFFLHLYLVFSTCFGIPEPFDGVYNGDEITVLSRLGSNGVQKEFCRMFSQPAAEVPMSDKGKEEEKTAAEDVWVLEW